MKHKLNVKLEKSGMDFILENLCCGAEHLQQNLKDNFKFWIEVIYNEDSLKYENDFEKLFGYTNKVRTIIKCAETSDSLVRRTVLNGFNEKNKIYNVYGFTQDLAFAHTRNENGKMVIYNDVTIPCFILNETQGLNNYPEFLDALITKIEETHSVKFPETIDVITNSNELHQLLNTAQ